MCIRRLAATVWTVASSTFHKGVSIVASRTLAIKTAREVLAESVDSTSGFLADGALVHIPADSVSFPLESSLADTLALGAQFPSGARLGR